MKFLTLSKDGGAESTVWAYTLIEWKRLFSVVLLRFEDGSRDAYHNHAFNCVSWVLSGELLEFHHESTRPNVFDRFDIHWPSWIPFITRRSTFHMVRSVGRSWVLSFRGPWSKTWKEYLPATDTEVELTHGRRVVGE